MAAQKDVREIALTMPGAREHRERFAFSVEVKGKPKGFVWAWNERVEPRKPRVPRRDVVALRVADQMEKAALLDADPEKFFTEPHYDGYPAVLCRLPAVRRGELRRLIEDAWRCVAPAAPMPGRATASTRQRRQARFEAELLEGHKGVMAVIVPFDPEQVFGEKPVRLAGRRHGWPVKGTIDRVPFAGYIGERWGRFFITVDPVLRAAARVSVGETLTVAVKPAADAETLATAHEQSKSTTQPGKARRDAREGVGRRTSAGPPRRR